MQTWRGLALAACMALGMSGEARAGGLEDANVAADRGDHKAVMSILKPHAEQGDALAQARVGWIYGNGLGVAQDYKKAVQWYTLSAEQGNSGAQSSLGFMYAKGQGVAQDYIKAHMWYNISAIGGGNKQAAPNRDEIAKYMTPDEIARARALASQCIAQKFKNCGS